MPGAELYLRAAGAAAFMPIMQYHSEFNHHREPLRDRTPWNVAERTGDERVVPVFRRLAELRERLVPYLAEQAGRALDGPPLMRGLFFDHPDDPAVWRYPLQFKLGDALLVAPVTDPDVSEMTVYLPGGRLGGRLDRPPAARRPGGRAGRPARPSPGGLHGGALARPVPRFHDLSRRPVAGPLLPRETVV
ncbi:TIM-barrel domain-containing protein [Nonomuraea ferruginea]